MAPASASAVVSHREDLHAGEAVGVGGEHRRVSVQAHLAQAWSQVVGVVGLAEGVFVDFSDVVVLRGKKILKAKESYHRLQKISD